MVTKPDAGPGVFLSWSGERSGAVAKIFRDWLSRLMPNVRPYRNLDDTSKGSGWSDEIRGELERSGFGIVFLTSENSMSPWILFEAGSLSRIGKSRVAAFLLDLKPTDVSGPLAQFPASRPIRQDCFRLLTSLNDNLGEHRLEQAVLSDAFDQSWPDVDQKIQAAVAAKPATAGGAPRSEPERTEQTPERDRRTEGQPVADDAEQLIIYETAQTMWHAIEAELERIVFDLQSADDECSARCLSLIREIESAALQFAGQPYRVRVG
ncbi:MAG: hypothetical protein QM674_01630 [Burkholderiaceae bacterium]